MLDIVIRNAEIIDGSGAPGFKGDVAIQGDTIIDLGSFPNAEAKTVIDAAGRVLSPGFIDMHSHADMSLPIAPAAESMLYQGITTVVTGQCGVSPAPLSEATKKQVLEVFGESEIPMPWDEWNSFGSFLSYLEKIKTAPNIAPLVGQGMVRAMVMGFSAARPSEEQLEQMQKEAVQAIEEGAIGISTGLIYPPGSYASTEELVEVIRPVGELNGIYFSHIRGEGDTLLEAISEAIEIGRQTGSSVQISHFKAAGASNWAKAGPALELIEKAQAEGMDVTADMYPYLAGSTSLVAMLPEWAQEGGKDAMVKRLIDPDTRVKMTQDMQTIGFFKVADWNQVLISESKKKEYAGRYIAELAAEAKKSPYDWIFDALLETEGEIGMIIFMMAEDNVRMQLPHPAMMIGTDGAGLATEGPLAKGFPHPRSFGTFPRVLGQYVRDEKLMPLETAIWKMTGFPAQKIRLADRGLVRKGYKADLVVFDPGTVADLSTYQNPFHYPAGIDHVLINGEVVIGQGCYTGALPGKMLRK